ncbi:hypothetical protein D5085_09685 [Ectothiorhodospiraceae bacterium BW-2]|nr:hypothetical protein D5085_09685 [Ectothiorhodospiraceae bacterium BW-2]
MRWLLNESIPLTTIRELEAAGHDVLAIKEHSLGSRDEDVMALVHRERRVIVTFERDYGELVFRYRLPQPAGVVYLRFAPQTLQESAAHLLQLIASGAVLEGKFTTVDRTHIRQRPLA